MKFCPKCYLVGDDTATCVNKTSGMPCPPEETIVPEKVAVLSYEGALRAVPVEKIAQGKAGRVFSNSTDHMDARLVLPVATPPVPPKLGEENPVKVGGFEGVPGKSKGVTKK